MAVKVKSDLRSAEGLTVYSDPAAGNLYLKIITAETDSARLTILNEKADIISELTVPVNQLTHVAINNLNNGLYIAKVAVNGLILKENFRI